MSLRTRLVLVLGSLAVAGLLAADVTTYYSLRSFLVQRVDRSLVASAGVLGHSPRFDPGDFRTLAASNPGGYVGVLTAGSLQWLQFTGRVGETVPPQPKLTAAQVSSLDPDATYTVAASHGGTRFRARLVPLRGSLALVLALPLGEVDATLHRLLLIELLVSLVVVGAVVGLGLWLVRVGLRPLGRIEETAGAIAAGDLSRRIEETSQLPVHAVAIDEARKPAESLPKDVEDWLAAEAELRG